MFALPFGSLVAQRAVPVVILERTGCRGFCPEYRLELFSDGRVRSTGIRHVQRMGVSTRHISRASVRRVQRAFDRRGFAALPARIVLDTPSCGAYITDQPSVFLTQRTRRGAHRVETDLGCESAPPAIEVLADLIDSVTGTSRWLTNVPLPPAAAASPPTD